LHGQEHGQDVGGKLQYKSAQGSSQIEIKKPHKGAINSVALQNHQRHNNPSGKYRANCHTT
jgi:hypothetical protein